MRWGRLPALSDATNERWRLGHVAAQEELASRSARSRLVRLDAGHGIPDEKPEDVVAAVRGLVEMLAGR